MDRVGGVGVGAEGKRASITIHLIGDAVPCSDEKTDHRMVECFVQGHTAGVWTQEFSTMNLSGENVLRSSEGAQVSLAWATILSPHTR
jgi:hypothetical protein